MFLIRGWNWTWYEHHLCPDHGVQKWNNLPALPIGSHLMIISPNVGRFCWLSVRRSASRHPIFVLDHLGVHDPHSDVVYQTVYKRYIKAGQNVLPVYSDPLLAILSANKPAVRSITTMDIAWNTLQLQDQTAPCFRRGTMMSFRQTSRWEYQCAHYKPVYTVFHCIQTH